jgi:hypothetical protein
MESGVRMAENYITALARIIHKVSAAERRYISSHQLEAGGYRNAAAPRLKPCK